MKSWQQRMAEIDAAVEERKRHLVTAPEYGWEAQARIKKELAKLQRENARLKARLKKAGTAQKERLPDDVVLGVMSSYTPMLPQEIHREIEEDWGEVAIRTVQRALARLLRAGKVERLEDGYLRARG